MIQVHFKGAQIASVHDEDQAKASLEQWIEIFLTENYNPKFQKCAKLRVVDLLNVLELILGIMDPPDLNILMEILYLYLHRNLKSIKTLASYSEGHFSQYDEQKYFKQSLTL